MAADQAHVAPRAVASSWYARMLGGGLDDADELIATRLPRAAARAAIRVRVLRGAAMWWLSRAEGALVLTRGEAGALSALVLAAWVGRRRVVLLELIPPPRARSAWRRALRSAMWRTFERPAVRRAMIAGQVLTEREREASARLYGIPATRLQYLPWAWCRDPAEPPPTGDREGVLASGRAGCDWPMLFSAAAGRDWPLTIVCGHRDLAAVNALNPDGRARVLSEAPRDEYDRLLRGASVFAMPLEDRPGSAGHVRLMTATQARTPTVHRRPGARRLRGRRPDRAPRTTGRFRHPAGGDRAAAGGLAGSDAPGRGGVRSRPLVALRAVLRCGGRAHRGRAVGTTAAGPLAPGALSARGPTDRGGGRPAGRSA